MDVGAGQLDRDFVGDSSCHLSPSSSTTLLFFTKEVTDGYVKIIDEAAQCWIPKDLAKLEDF